MKTNNSKTIGLKKNRKPRYVTEERLQEFGKELSAEIRKDMVTEARLQEFGKELSADIRKDMVTKDEFNELKIMLFQICNRLDKIEDKLAN
jgi:hypothetical protein